MRWLKIFLFSASPCLLPVVAVSASTTPSSSREGYAFVSNNIPVSALLGRGFGVSCNSYGNGACSTTTTTLTHQHHRRDKALLRLNYLPLQQRWRVKNSNSRAIASFPLGASLHNEDNDGTTALTTITTTTKVIKRRKSWEESYALLCKYKDIHGHCNVPQSEKPLGTWVNSQRMEHARYLLQQQSKIIMHHDDEGGRGKDTTATKKGGDSNKKLKKSSMTAQRKKLLDEIGFVWDAMGHTWSTRYAELCEFRKINGHCVVPRSNGRLGAWVEKQRIEYKKYRLLQQDEGNDNDDDDCNNNHDYEIQIPKTIISTYEDRIRKMNDIGFVWDVRETQFEQKLGQLRIFKEVNGHIDPRLMNGQLALWVRKWEQQYRKYLDAQQQVKVKANADVVDLEGILPENRRRALEEVGFCKRMFDELPRARWVKNRRATWEERYEELEEYKVEHGHCVVPKKEGPLGSWVRTQRHLMKEKETENGTSGSSSFENGGQLSDERIDVLNRLGFVWDVHQWQWNQTYHELLLYKEKHNRTNVPMSYGGLGLWVFNQRAHYNSFRRGEEQSLMTPDRLEMLRNIGFEFDLGKKIRSAADERWQMRLAELKEYEEKWGTSFNVKQSHDPTLYNWCGHQRRCYRAKLRGKNSTLNEEREDALKAIGFLDGIII